MALRSVAVVGLVGAALLVFLYGGTESTSSPSLTAQDLNPSAGRAPELGGLGASTGIGGSTIPHQRSVWGNSTLSDTNSILMN